MPEPADHTDQPGSEPPSRSFREKGLEYFRRHLGEPANIPVDNGTLYRWRLPRLGHPGLHFYVTIDAPELPQLAHIMVSDPAPDSDLPVRSFLVKNEAEFLNVLGFIRTRTGRV